MEQHSATALDSDPAMTALREYCSLNDEGGDLEGGRRRSTDLVITHLRKVAQLWFLEYIRDNANHINPSNMWYRVEAFGSAALGTQTEESDVDVILLAPYPHATREDFFKSFAAKLRSFDATEVIPITNAAVPLLTFSYAGAAVDLSFASIAMEKMPSDTDLVSEHILDLVQENGWRSLQGLRVALLLPQLISDMTLLRQAVRFVKIWASRRGIYGNIFTYPGGITWTIMVGAVMKQMPTDGRASSSFQLSDLLKLFFSYFCDYFKRPIPLPPVHITATALTPDSAVMKRYKKWDPQSEDAEDVFPVLNPSVPYTNSSYNVTLSSLNAIRCEFERVMELLRTWTIPWGQMFQPLDYPSLGCAYVCIETSTNNTFRFPSWCNYFESKLKYFIYALETGSPDSRPRIIPTRYTNYPVPTRKSHAIARYFIALQQSLNIHDLDYPAEVLASTLTFREEHTKPRVTLVKPNHVLSHMRVGKTHGNNTSKDKKKRDRVGTPQHTPLPQQHHSHPSYHRTRTTAGTAALHPVQHDSDTFTADGGEQFPKGKLPVMHEM